MRDDLGCYVEAKADRARSAVSQLGNRLVSSILLTIAASALLATAAALLVLGAAGGVAAVLGGNLWLANVITGVAVLGVFACVRAISTAVRRNGRMRRLKRRYEGRKVGNRSRMASGAPHGREHDERS